MSPQHVFNESVSQRQAGSSPHGSVTIAWDFDNVGQDLRTFGQCPFPREPGNFERRLLVERKHRTDIHFAKHVSVLA